MSYKGYKRVVTHRFWAAGELWEAQPWGKDFIRIEEVRKNGQEDTHMHGEFVKRGDRWDVMMDDNYPCENISEYASESTLQAILTFLNEHGTPEE